MSAPGLLTLLIELVAYRPGAMHDDFGDGGHQSFDAVELRVVEGPLAGARITAFVDSRDVAAVARWNRPGTQLRVTVDAELLEATDVLFVGALAIEGALS